MAAAAMPTGVMGEMPPPQPPTPAPRTDPTPTDPQKLTADQAKDGNGLTQLDRDNLMLIRRTYKERRSLLRRIRVRSTLRKIEYIKGNQYYVIGPDGFTFQDPFMSDLSLTGTEQGKNDEHIYQRVNNIIQWFERGLVATLSSQVTAIRFQPTDAQSDLGNRVAQEASRANAYIERLNEEPALLRQKVSYLCLDGCYFVYTRPVRDARLSGDRMEEVVDEQMQDQQVAGNRYLCPTCGLGNPADQAVSQVQRQCVQCNTPLSDKDFFSGVTMPMPSVVNTKQVPHMQVRKSIFNSLHVDADFDADSETGDPLVKVRVLDLSLETDIGTLRSMYPSMWDELAGGDAGGSGDAEIDRISRIQATNPVTQDRWWSRGAGVYTQGDLPTYSRTWITPDAFNSLKKKVDADRLRSIFPDGVCLASWNSQFLDVRPAKLTEEWTWGGTRRGFGLYPPAILDPAMDYQDRYNDAGNTQDEYYDRMAVPAVAYDANAIAGKSLSGKYWAVGTWMPVRVKPKEGRTLDTVVKQFEFKMDHTIENYQQRLLTMAQMVTSVPPQIFGQTQTDIDTFGGQQQALGVAQGNLALYLSEVRGESARTAKNAIKCLAQNATQAVYDVLKGDDNRYRNQPIDLDALKNEIDTYPDDDQGVPESIHSVNQRWEKIVLEGSQNPMVLALMDNPKNQRMAARALLPPDVVIPDEKFSVKVLEDIQHLMEGAPQLGPHPGTGQIVLLPSILPDPIVDNLEVTKSVASEYAVENYWQLKEQNPQQLENILLYVQFAEEFQRTKELQAQMPPPGAPAPQPQPTN